MIPDIPADAQLRLERIAWKKEQALIHANLHNADSLKRSDKIKQTFEEKIRTGNYSVPDDPHSGPPSVYADYREYFQSHPFG